MCGRTCCTLCPEALLGICCSAEGGVTSNGVSYDLEWRCPDRNHADFKPSYNTPPTSYTPVLIEEVENREIHHRFLEPMMWGLIPHYHPNSQAPTAHGLSTSNCRIESVLQKATFSVPLKQRRRCAVIAEGFYEWHRPGDKAPKTAYFFHMPQPDEVQIWNSKTWSRPAKEEKEYLVKPMFMAGIYNSWEYKAKGYRIESYSVITTAAHPTIAHVHDRMPAILPDQKAVDIWLNPEISSEEAVSHLGPYGGLAFYQVSSLVNSTRNNSSDCNQPVTKEGMKRKPTAMEAWLQGATRSRSSNGGPEAKVPKQEVKSE